MKFVTNANSLLLQCYALMYKFPDEIFDRSVQDLVEKNNRLHRCSPLQGFMYNYEFYGRIVVGVKPMKLHAELEEQMDNVLLIRQDSYDGLAICKKVMISALNLTRDVDHLKLVYPAEFHNFIDEYSEEIAPEKVFYPIVPIEQVELFIEQNKAGIEKMQQMLVLNLLVS